MIKQAKEEAKDLAFTEATINTLQLKAEEAAKKTVDELIKNGITDNKILIDAMNTAENNAIKLGLSDEHINNISKQSKIIGDEYEAKKRKELEDSLEMEFPSDPTYPERDLTDDLNILIPFILKNMEMSLEDIAKKTKIPLNRIYDLETDITRKIDEVIKDDIENSTESFTNKITKEEKENIHKKLKADLLNKFETFDNPTKWSSSDWLIIFIILICSILLGFGVCKYFTNKKNSNIDFGNTNIEKNIL